MEELLLLKILKNENVSSPKNLPNNLAELKRIYNLNSKEFADKIGFTKNHLEKLEFGESNLSGKATIRVLNELNISFSCLYNIQSQVQILCENYDTIFCVFTSDKRLVGLNELARPLAKFLGNIVELDMDYDNIIKVTNWDEFMIENNKLEFRTMANSKNRTLSKKRTEKFQGIVDQIKGIDNSKLYYWVKADYKHLSVETLNIDTLATMDKRINRVLQDIPFRRLETNVERKKNCKFDKEKTLLLDKKYSVLTKDGIIITDKLKEENYKISKGNVTFKYISKTERCSQKFKICRLLKGYSLIEMADLFGVSLETYRLIEVGHNKISSNQMWKIENNLGVLLENILDVENYYK